MEPQLTRPLDPVSVALIEEQVLETMRLKGLAPSWDSFFRFLTVFEDIGRYTTDGLGNIQSVDFEGLVLEVTSGSTAEAFLTLNVAAGTLVSHLKQTRCRFAFKTTNTSNVNFDVVTIGGAGGYIGVGFRSGQMLGLSSDGTTEKTVVLRTAYTGDTFYEVEILFFPGNRMVFLLDGVERGMINTNFPSAVPTYIFSAGIEKLTAATQNGHVAYFELIQSRL